MSGSIRGNRRIQFLYKYGLDGNGAGLDALSSMPRGGQGESSDGSDSDSVSGTGDSPKTKKEDEFSASVKWSVEDCNGSKAVCCGEHVPSEIQLQAGKEQDNVIAAAAVTGANSLKINNCVVKL